MKNTASFFLLVLVIIVSCSRRKSYEAEKYQELQESYELEKLAYTEERQKSDKTKQHFFEDNKAALTDFVNLTETIMFTDFDKVYNDTTYFKSDVTMKPVNFGLAIKSRYQRQKKDQNEVNGPTSNVIFLNRNSEDNSNGVGSNYLENIKSCLLLKETSSKCLNDIKLSKIKEMLTIEYAFIVDRQLMIEPEINGNGFTGGIYTAKVICYSIKNREPVFSFFVVAGSSDEVKTSGRLSQGPKREIQLDFNRNVKKEILKSCRKHFQFIDDISFIYNI